MKEELIKLIENFNIVNNILIDLNIATCSNTHRIEKITIDYSIININEYNKYYISFNIIQDFIKSIRNKNVKIYFTDNNCLNSDKAFIFLMDLLVVRYRNTLLSKIAEYLVFMSFDYYKYNISLSDDKYSSYDFKINKQLFDLKYCKIKDSSNYDIDKLSKNDLNESHKLILNLINNTNNNYDIENKFFIVALSKTNNSRKILQYQSYFDYLYSLLLDLIKNLREHIFCIKDRNGNKTRVILLTILTE